MNIQVIHGIIDRIIFNKHSFQPTSSIMPTDLKQKQLIFNFYQRVVLATASCGLETELPKDEILSGSY